MNWLHKKWWRLLNRLGLISAKASRDSIEQLIMANEYRVDKGVVRLVTNNKAQASLWKRGKGGKWAKFYE